ncbi:MAG: LytTR family DNA-binding domain-containing protein [Chitinophagaceae bacterium]
MLTFKQTKGYMLIKAYVLDDEDLGRKNLIQLIEKFCSDKIEIVGSNTSPLAARKEIDVLEPNLLFLDVQMPAISGFEFLELFSEISFDVIFVTAYDRYSLNAIKVGAIDYILKPVNIQELKLACKKVHQRFSKLNIGKSFSKIMVYSGNGYNFIEKNEIVSLQGQDNYTKIVFLNKPAILVSKTIKEYEDLDKNTFFRIHKSAIINLNHLKSFFSHDGGTVVLTDGSEFSVSRRRIKEFKEKINWAAL